MLKILGISLMASAEIAIDHHQIECLRRVVVIDRDRNHGIDTIMTDILRITIMIPVPDHHVSVIETGAAETAGTGTETETETGIDTVTTTTMMTMIIIVVVARHMRTLIDIISVNILSVVEVEVEANLMNDHHDDNYISEFKKHPVVLVNTLLLLN